MLWLEIVIVVMEKLEVEDITVDARAATATEGPSSSAPGAGGAGWLSSDHIRNKKKDM